MHAMSIQENRSREEYFRSNAIENRFKEVSHFLGWRDRWSPIANKNASLVFNNSHPPLPNNECGFSDNHNEVWLFKYSSQIIDVIKLRESLRGYVEYHLNISSLNGTPILRPMFYDFNDTECYQAEDQYMFGTDYLVAHQTVSRSVYLLRIMQQNVVWQHFYTKQIYQGGQRYDINITLNDFPLFVKATSLD